MITKLSALEDGKPRCAATLPADPPMDCQAPDCLCARMPSVKPSDGVALAAASKEWIESRDGRESSRAHTLGISIRSDEYLRNRLLDAFRKGWEAKARQF